MKLCLDCYVRLTSRSAASFAASVLPALLRFNRSIHLFPAFGHIAYQMKHALHDSAGALTMGLAACSGSVVTRKARKRVDE